MAGNLQPGSPGGAETKVKISLDLLFRRRAGQLTATLTRILGVENLDLVDDVVQDAFIQALRKWPYTGMPDNPGAWILQVAKNRALDTLRRNHRWRDKCDELERSILPDRDAGRVYFSDELEDDQLRMIFTCCHPSLPPHAQVALTLKAVGGFNVNEIARSFLTSRTTIAQRLVRAKRTLRDQGVQLSLPTPDTLQPRVDSVLSVLYLMFNEGHSTSGGDMLVRADLCREAVRLAELVAAHPLVGGPRAHALASLFLFQTARLPGRTDRNGQLLLLEQQDRSLWDRSLLRRALEHLQLAARGRKISSYHLQAEIASHHALAPDYGSTNWIAILHCYDQLLELEPSPVVALNRIVALAQVKGADAALRALDDIRDLPALQRYHLLFAVEGDLLFRLDRKRQAKNALSKAILLAGSEPDRRYLEERMQALEAGIASGSDSSMADFSVPTNHKDGE